MLYYAIIKNIQGGNTMPFVEINVKNEIEKQRHNNPKRKKSTAIPLITALSSVLFNCLIKTCQR